jgi:hypothetical protein
VLPEKPSQQQPRQPDEPDKNSPGWIHRESKTLVSLLGCTVRMEAVVEPQGGAYVDGFAIQIGSVWVVIPILVAVVFGLWKLGRIIRAAISN